MLFKHLAIFFTDMNKMGTFLHILNKVPSFLCINRVESLYGSQHLLCHYAIISYIDIV